MLEPLIVLTVLNCFFMFSSTVTTCALWWQYRSHRCCFKKKPAQQTSKSALRKSKSNCTCRTYKKAGKSKQDNLAGAIDASKSSTTLNRESKSKKSQKQKPRTNLKYLSQYKKSSDEKIPSTEKTKDKELEERTKMSEGSQTANDNKSAVVMEYSTLQKIVQILDNDSELNPELTATKIAINNTKQNVEDKEKKPNFDVEHKIETQSPVIITQAS